MYRFGAFSVLILYYLGQSFKSVGPVSGNFEPDSFWPLWRWQGELNPGGGHHLVGRGWRKGNHCGDRCRAFTIIGMGRSSLSGEMDFYDTGESKTIIPSWEGGRQNGGVFIP